MKDTVISNIRMKSNAGWYIGSVSLNGSNVEPYERDSFYYPSEEWLINEYPNSISMEDVLKRVMT